MRRSRTSRKASPGRIAAFVLGSVLVGALTGCEQAGSATTRIDQAEVEIEELVDRIVAEIGLEVTSDVPLGSRRPCQQRGLGEGASNALSRRGPLPDIDDPVGRSAAILVEAGYELVDSDLDAGVFGRRDGIRITVVEDAPTAELAIDANTGCRPFPNQ